MNATRSTPVTRRPGLRGAGGYSLIEMTVAVAMAAIIGLGIYAIFNAQQRSSRAQKTYNDLQTSCTFAMDTIKNDLLLAGYNARTTAQPIKAAASSSIAFEFFDQNAGDDESVYPLTAYSADTKVTLSLSGTTLTKQIERWHNGDAIYKTPQTVTLANNVQNLDFTYLKGNNEAWVAAGSPPTNLGEIRAIRINLRCRADEKGSAIFNAPELGTTTPHYQEIALTAEVRPRNVNISRNPDDDTAPAVPASKPGQFIKVWDEGTCGCLDLNWSSNTDSDIAGYMIYYGVSSGNYDGRVRVNHQTGATQTYKLPDLSQTNAPYFIVLSAFDNSGNQSAFSTEVTGNPTPSIRTLAGTSAGNDTTITPLPPAAPSGLTVSLPQELAIDVGWGTNYTDCMTTKTFGYRLYRSRISSFTPSGTTAGTGNCIADETTLKPGTIKFEDRGSVLDPLEGCKDYTYQLAVVNCDPAQISCYTEANCTTNYTTTQFTSITGSPRDDTPTSAPEITAKSGYRRIILSVTNPSRDPTKYPDFLTTRIYFSTTAVPVLTTTVDAQGYYIVTGGQLIPDDGGEMTLAGGPHAINFDDENNEVPPGGLGDPQLDPTKTYYFLAVAYDYCLNVRTDSLISQTSAEQCSDGLPAEAWRDAPPAPENIRVTKGCDGRPLKIEWDYDASNYINHPDFQGFRVVRCTGTGCTPMQDPNNYGIVTGDVIGTTTLLFPDKYVEDDTVDDGVVYNYRVYAGDCYYMRWLQGLLAPAEIADNPPGNNASSSNLYDLSLGYFGRAQVTGDATTTLVGAHTTTDTTINVASTAAFTRKTIRIGSETIECTGVTATSFTGCFRGFSGIPEAYEDGRTVTSWPPAPPRAAVTGDLSLNPATFRHNIVRVGAKNTAESLLLFRKLEPMTWTILTAWFKKLLYGGSPSAVTQQTLYDGATLPAGSNVTLAAVQIGKKLAPTTDVPLEFTFLRESGTLDNLADMRNDVLDLTWKYRNDSTLQECSRAWLPPDRITVPEGPTVYGVAQNKPYAGTLAWEVPGSTSNAKDAVVVPAGSQVRVSTYVQNNAAFGTSIVSARLYYYAGDPADTAAPAVTSAYPTCTPYTLVDMTNVSGTTLWEATIPPTGVSPSDHDGKSIWFFIVGVDSEDNFDRAPEIDAGAYQYFQRAPDPCVDTPAAPVLADPVTKTSSSVTLDWSASWTGSPATYKNSVATGGGDITDLAGFKIYRQIGAGSVEVLATTPDPLAPATQMYTDTFTVRTANLTAAAAYVAAPATNTLTVDTTAGFRDAGKVTIDGHVVSYTSKTLTEFLGCSWPVTAVGYSGGIGTAVIQDLLALENISYTVRAVDSCSPIPNVSGDSNTVTAFPPGGCSPVCNMTVSPTSIQPGEPFTITVTACAKAGGTLDTIYVQGCSACDDDAIALTETAANTGIFTATVGTEARTSATCTGGGGASILTVRSDVAGQILIGGWADTPGSWGGGTCQSGGFTCGAEKVVDVAPAAADPCAGIATPTTPTMSSVTPNSCNAAKPSINVAWAGDDPTATLFYRVYECKNADGAAACTLAKISPTGVEPPATAQTTRTYTFTETANIKANDYEYWFQVEAVNTAAGCADTTQWKYSLSTSMKDSCD